MYYQTRLFLFFFITGVFVQAQETISGTVIDSETKKPLENAAVYFDKSSVWTATDAQGHFELEIKNKIFTSLVINFLGYEQVVLKDPFSKKEWKVQMIKSRDELNPVYLTQEKLAKKRIEASKDDAKHRRAGEMHNIDIFKHYFIGKGDASNRTEILNEEALRTITKMEKDSSIVIVVSAVKPLKIVNDYLKYKITYTLDTAQIVMKKNPEFGIWVPRTFQSAGNYFFKDLLGPEKRNNRFHKRRKKAYEGSVLHFMRALAKSRMEEEGFSAYRLEKKAVVPKHLKNGKPPEKHIIVSQPVNFKTFPHENFTEVMPPANFLVIYKEDMRTQIKAKQNFGIDEYGNYFPWYALKFTGHMGFTGVSSAVPLNYVPKEN